MKRVFLMALAASWAGPALAQSSSLYVQQQTSYAENPFPTIVPDEGGMAVTAERRDDMTAEVQALSFAAVSLPDARTYQINDIITIVVRESTVAGIEAGMETEKEVTWEGEIAQFPQLTISDLLNMQIKPNSFEDGTPKLNVGFESEFDGEGEYIHATEMATRLAARVIDVKPNGLLVLEARKYIENDKETMNMVVTGTCSVDDIGIDSTVLSTNLYDLHISKQHTGELRKNTKKGLLSNLMDLIFNF